MKPLKSFIAIDFETANAKRVSACSLGVAKIVDGVIAEHRTYLINPVGGYSPINIRIHGITPDKTASAPTFDKIFPALRQDFESLPILCYSAFDRSVFEALSDHYGLEYRRDIEFFDVCEYAHRCLRGLPNYKLPTVSKHLNLADFAHHDAEADALQCARIFLALAENGVDENLAASARTVTCGCNEQWKEPFVAFAIYLTAKGFVDVEDAYNLQLFLDSVAGRNKLLRSIADMTAVVLEDGIVTERESTMLCAMMDYSLEYLGAIPASGNVSSASVTAFEREAQQKIPELAIPSGYAPVMKDIPEQYKERWEYVRSNPFTTFASSIVAVTGEGTRIGRMGAEEKLAAVGATIKNSAPTRNTDFCIVLGESPENCTSGKACRARDLQSSGSPIRILNEDEFIEMLKSSIAETAEQT